MDVRKDFPLIVGTDVAYLDSAATTQKPQLVIDAVDAFYRKTNANVHRGAYRLSQEATLAYEDVREKICHFLGTQDREEIIYTSGTTAGINLVASSWGDANVKAGDDVLVTRMEHHSNFVPWQALAHRKGANFRIVELDAGYRLDLEDLAQKITPRTRVVAISFMSNVLGTVNPIAKIAKKAKEVGAAVVVDAAQAASQVPIEIKSLGPIDFLAFSGHKVCGPTGVGALWARKEVLRTMPPYQFGGDMILNVEDQRTQWNELPWKFEAGTPNMAGVVGLGAALDYLRNLGLAEIQQAEKDLTAHALASLQKVAGLRIFGPSEVHDRGGAVSFNLESVHPHDLATFLDENKVAIRAGHHCAQPLVVKYGMAATARMSPYIYNTKEEIDRLAGLLADATRFFKR